MKTIEVTRHGGPDVLQIVEKPTPTPQAGEVLIEVKAAGINFADLMARAGSYPVAPPPPFVPGFEAAGVVSAVGEGVPFPVVGARVVAMLPNFSGYAEFAVVDAARAVPLPDGLGFASATALLIQGLTAYFLLEQAAQIKSGQSVLITGAAGGVGSLAVQIAKKLGAGTVIGLASTEEKRQLVKELGADAAIDYTKDGWIEQVKAATDGKGADIFLDATGDITTKTLGALADKGKWLVFGAQTGGAPIGGDFWGSLLFDNKTITGFTLYSVSDEDIARVLPQMMGWATSGELRILASDSFPLADAAKAHEAIAARRTTGKVVLVP